MSRLNRTSPPIIASTGESYKILDWLGDGGNGEVHLVTATSGINQGLLFALKVFLQMQDETRLLRFRREIDLLSKLDHPSVLKIFDHGKVEIEINGNIVPHPFAVFEYLPQTLADAFKTGLTAVEKAAFTLQLISGLQYLSSISPQIIHRDIKPSNIFVRGKSCILGDLGLVKVLDDELPDDDKQFVFETVGPALPRYYRTPDLVAYCRDGIPLTTKSDVFQLGLVLAKMYTSRVPLKPAANILDDVELHPLSPISGSLEDQIRPLLENMLALAPTGRPSAAELIEGWDGIFRTVVDMSLDLEGAVFP